jgi:hypothetical protein
MLHALIARVDQQQTGWTTRGDRKEEQYRGGHNELPELTSAALLMPIDQVATLSILLTVEICYSVAQSIRSLLTGGPCVTVLN